MSLSDIDVLLNTHGHLDHAGGNWEIKEISGATIYIHPADEPLACNLEDEVDFHESIQVSDALAAAVAKVLQRLPGASKREIALGALDELLYSVPQLRLRETAMPVSAGPTMLSHIEAAMGAGDPI